ncbi:MBL fold metallo-hydrolase [Streptomyces sp. NPDC007875]|uniref:MBL fold metallo-hydrolase n=1 Tax=Streptomyces sp. NPDC007875 TaxID=3364783 RepID=UPI003699E266
MRGRPIRTPADRWRGRPAVRGHDGHDAWLVTDEQAELRSRLREIAAAHGVRVRAGDVELGGVRVRCHPVAHTSHPAYGYRIETQGTAVVWAPEFWEFPGWAAGADLMFAEAAGWNRPIRFRGGVGGHASVRTVGEQAARHGVRRLVYTHIGRPTLCAIDAGAKPEIGEWGVQGRAYSVRVPAREDRKELAVTIRPGWIRGARNADPRTRGSG